MRHLKNKMEKIKQGCGREWTESACVKTEPDYCGEGDNLCPECGENIEIMTKTLADKKQTQEQFNYAHQGMHSNPSVLEVKDVKEFVAELKNAMCYAINTNDCIIKHTCPTSRRIDKLAGDL